MPLNPAVSFKTEDAVVDTSFFKTTLIVGQSNVATPGLYKNLEFKTEAQINTMFGAGSHIAACLKDARTMMSDSILKPKLWAISYEDEATATARELESTVVGTATESRTLNLKLNTLNPDRMQTQEAVVLALRNTKGSSCGDFSQNSVEVGAPSNANMPINPILADAFTNDVIVEVEITTGMTETQAATAITAAITAKTSAIYSAASALGVVTLTANHKGALGNLFTIEYVDSTIAEGLSISTAETVAGLGVVDATGILSIQDEDSIPLEELDFDYVVLPIDYSIAALVTDAKAKWDNVLEYNNQTLDYRIMRTTALDLSNDTELDALAVSEPVEESGIVKTIMVAEKNGLTIKGVSAYLTRASIESKQFTPLQRENNGRISIGNAYTLSDSTGFVNLERVLTASLVRELYVEKFIPADFPETNFTSGTSVNAYTYNKDDVISKFESYRDIIDGTKVNTQYGTDFAGIISNSEDARSRYDELLEISVSFDTGTKQLTVKAIFELINAIKSILATASYQ